MKRLLNIESLLKSGVIAGIECLIQENGSYLFNLVLLKKSKSNIKLVNSKILAGNLEEIKTVLPKDIPVILVINGKGVLHKKVSIDPSTSDTGILNKILPNASVDDFYIQQTNTVSDETLVSITRKEIANNILGDFKDASIEVINLSLGPFCIAKILPLIKENQGNNFILSFLNYELSFNRNQLEKYNSLNDKIDPLRIQLGDELIEDNLLIPFSAGLSYYLEPLYPSLYVDSVSNIDSEVKNKIIFKLGSLTSLTLFFIILLVNFICFSYYNSKKGELSLKTTGGDILIQNYDSLQDEFKSKESFLDKYNLLSSSKASYYADQLAKDIPLSIELTKLNINPSEKKANEDVLKFTSRKIELEGMCIKSIDLNKWITLLKTKAWIKRVDVVNYTLNKEEEKGVFKLEINLN